MFCDASNMLPRDTYQLKNNKLYIDYLPNGIRFTELDKTIHPYIPTSFKRCVD